MENAEEAQFDGDRYGDGKSRGSMEDYHGKEGEIRRMDGEGANEDVGKWKKDK
jgi:hypothetical protein